MYDPDLIFGGAIAFLMFVAVIALICAIAVIIARWKLFKKAGYEGWESIIPFYSDYVMCDVVFGKGLYFLFLLIPSLIFSYERVSSNDLGFVSSLASFVSGVFSIVLYYKLAGVFNKSSAFGVGLALLTPIFILILAFDSNVYYSGPSAKSIGDIGIGYGAGGYGRTGSYGSNYSGYNNSGYNNDYPTYGGNNSQGYPSQQQGYQNNDYNQQQSYQSDIYQSNSYQNNGYQNNGFQAQGQSQKQNPFEQSNGNNYYGNNTDYSNYNNYGSYNNQQNDTNNNNGF